MTNNVAQGTAAAGQYTFSGNSVPFLAFEVGSGGGGLSCEMMKKGMLVCILISIFFD